VPWSDKHWRALADATGTLTAMRKHMPSKSEADRRGWLQLLDLAKDPIRFKPLGQLDGVPMTADSVLEPKLECRLLEWSVGVVADAMRHFLELDMPETWRSTSGEDVWPERPSQRSADVLSWRRLLACTKAILDGIPNSLSGLCLSAKLTEMKHSWLRWKVLAEELPRSRPNGGPRWLWSRPSKKGKAGTDYFARTMPILMRHGIALKSRPLKDDPLALGALVPGTDRFFDNSPSHTFRVFCRSLRAARDRGDAMLGASASSTGRRVFVLHAGRGVGKGHFFECLSRESRLNEFAAASWPEEQEGQQGQQGQYCAQASFNLSFCHEVASVFDRLANLLVERAHVVFPAAPGSGAGPAELIHDANLQLGKNRVGRLKRILQLYAEHRESAGQRRLFVAVNGFNFLFDERGYPKNAQLHRLVTALLGKEHARVPVDFVLVCTESGFPRLFRSTRSDRTELRSGFADAWAGIPPIPMCHLVAPADPEKQASQVNAILHKLDVCIASAAKLDADNQFFFHVLHGALASTTVIKYFPEVALAIAARPGAIQARDHDVTAGNGTLKVPVDLDDLRHEIFERAMSDDASAERVVRDLPRLMRCLSEFGLDPTPRAAPLRAQCFFEKADGENQSEERSRMDDVAPGHAAQIDQDFAFLFRETASNRFLMTIFCAAASEAAGGCGPVDSPIAADEAVTWIRNALTRRLGDTPSQREDAIIATVLTAYRQRHEQLRALPRREAFKDRLKHDSRRLKNELPRKYRKYIREIPSAFCDVMAGPLGWALQQEVLWHLAVVGHPVESDVLAEAPKIQAAAMRIVRLVAGVVDKKPFNASQDDRRLYRRPLTQRIVDIALDLLVHRCLIFRMHPVSLEVPEALVANDLPFDLRDADQLAKHRERRAESDRAEARAAKDRRKRIKQAAANAEKSGTAVAPPPPCWRFSLHRFVQRAIFRRLHSPYVEYPQVDQFSLSMWATQPDDLPRPNAAAARDISELMADWTGYPRSVRRVDRQSAYHSARRAARKAAFDESPSNDPDRERVMSLPARMLRAAFGVVRSVFSVGVVSRYHESQSDALRAPQEGYFEQHRLQIRWLLHNAVDLMRLGRDRPETPGIAVAPFFAEEIVWLYNECGLLCLVEGRLEAAAGLFRRAWRAAQQLEPGKEHGALWCRIHLNLAIVEIERGQIRAARHNLEAIRTMPDENPILRLLAHGLFGMTEHLMGNLSGAEAIYTHVIADLQAYGQSRAIAIFSRQLGELYRRQGVASFDKSEVAIESAIERAHQGGHEDIRQLAKLSRARLRIDRLTDKQVVGHVQEELDAIERYGYSMGMPRIVAEVAYARSSYLLSLGETHYAMSLAADSLELATANDLRLRQVTALALLAKSCEHRGMQAASEPLRLRAAELAEACDYTGVRLGTVGR
jgi:hypothetical protein